MDPAGEGLNYNAPIHVTLSPERHADRVGLPCTRRRAEVAEEWVADPSWSTLRGRLGHNLHGCRQRADNTEPLFSGDVEITSDQYRAFDVIWTSTWTGRSAPETSPWDPDAGPASGHGNLHEAGPHDVESFTYSGGSWLDQIVYMPEDIEELSDVPVVISSWKRTQLPCNDYLGEHLASHGYVVMCTATGPGRASSTRPTPPLRTPTTSSTRSRLTGRRCARRSNRPGQHRVDRIHSRGGGRARLRPHRG